MAERLATVVPPSRLHVIPNMVDIAANDAIARQPASPPLADRLLPAFLLFIGKLEQNKGAGLLVEVFRAVRQRTDMPLPPLLVVGNGPLQQPIAQALGQLGVEVEMLSWVAHDDVLRLMARCETLLFPSLWGEPLSRVLLEASALGAPIIAMRTGGTSDLIVDGETGMLVSSAAAMADQLIALLRAPERRRAVGEQARIQAIQRFSVEAVLPRVEALYDSLQHHKGK
jgi:glycosyltransferase involved in cell wall biosynthesis